MKNKRKRLNLRAAVAATLAMGSVVVWVAIVWNQPVAVVRSLALTLLASMGLVVFIIFWKWLYDFFSDKEDEG
jgi:hypothetical protein